MPIRFPKVWTSTTASLLQDAPTFDPDGEEQGTFRVQWRKAGKIDAGPALPGARRKTPKLARRCRLALVCVSRSMCWPTAATARAANGADIWRSTTATAGSTTSPCRWPMMAGDGAEYRRELLRHGFILAPGKTAREQLEIYLAMWRPKRRVRCVGKVGWHGPRFVLPDRTFGPGGETVVLQADRPAKFAVAGSFAEWKRLVAAPAAGNSRLAFALSASFAGPLLHRCRQESGGFHFKGGSSIGKTSILHAARSTWGCDAWLAGGRRTTPRRPRRPALATRCSCWTSLEVVSRTLVGRQPFGIRQA